MKRSKVKHVSTTVLALGLALGSVQVSPVLLGQPQSHDPNAQQDQQKSEIFVGKLVKASNGQYALLTDEKAGKGVFLDSKTKLKKFEGKNVKVTGVFDTAKNIVHVIEIEPA